jgi:hypothetical protein
MLNATKVPQLTILDVPYGQISGYSPGRLAAQIAASGECMKTLKQRLRRMVTCLTKCGESTDSRFASSESSNHPRILTGPTVLFEITPMMAIMCGKF